MLPGLCVHVSSTAGPLLPVKRACEMLCVWGRTFEFSVLYVVLLRWDLLKHSSLCSHGVGIVLMRCVSGMGLWLSIRGFQTRKAKFCFGV